MTQGTIDLLKAKKLCHRCVGENYLSMEIESKGEPLECSYCNRTANSYRIGEVAKLVEIAFNHHYKLTPAQPNSLEYSLQCDKELGYEWKRNGEPVVDAIMNAADLPEAAAEDVQRILADQYLDTHKAKIGEETEFCAGSYYEENGASGQSWQEEWYGFEKSLKTEARFFSRTAARHLASVFSGIETMRTRDDQPLILEAGPGTPLKTIYRARVFQSDKMLEEAIGRPDLHLGPPPAMLASAGRMNAHGISVFYGANDPKVAIAEVRPPVGSKVAVARFEIVRSLRLLDLRALNAACIKGSIFDPQYADRLEHAAFLSLLCQHITKPVMPDDAALDYLPTQAVADFLATEAEILLDGIIFPSVQFGDDELNVALFNKAARVEMMDIPSGTEISTRTGQNGEDGWEVEYSVIEQVPPPKDASDEEITADYWLNMSALFNAEDLPLDYDDRAVSLRIMLDTVEVHIVQPMKFPIPTEAHSVRRHRLEKREYKFQSF
jgi:hypothetical protein